MEFVLAMTVTAIIGLSVGGVSMVFSNAYKKNETYGTNMAMARATMTRMQDLLRKAKLVTSSTTAGLLIWTNDLNQNGTIEKSELVLWSYSSTTQQLNEAAIVIPASLQGTLNITLALSQLTPYSTGAALVNGDQYVQQRTLLTGVTAFNFSTDVAGPMSTLVKIDMTVGTGNEAVPLRSCTSLRADATSRVSLSNNVYNLAAPTH